MVLSESVMSFIHHIKIIFLSGHLSQVFIERVLVEYYKYGPFWCSPVAEPSVIDWK